MSYKIEQVFFVWFLTNVFVFMVGAPVEEAVITITRSNLTKASLVNTCDFIRFIFGKYWIISTLGLIAWTFVAPSREEVVEAYYEGLVK